MALIDATGGLFSAASLAPEVQWLALQQNYTHQRQAIRTAARATLMAQSAAAGRIYASRTIPVRKAETEVGQPAAPDTMPVVLIYTNRDRVLHEKSDDSPRVLRHELELIVEVVSKISDGVDAQLDTIAQVIEGILLSDETLSGACAAMVLDRTEIGLAPADDGDEPMGSAALFFLVEYDAPAGIYPQTPFRELNVEWDTAPPVGDKIDAEDHLELEQE